MEDAVRRARRGDIEAFAAIVQPELGDLRRLATAIVLDRQLAEDVVQDSLVAAWHGLDGLRDPARFQSWLRTIVANRARNAVRRARTIRLIELARPRVRPDRDDPSDASADVLAVDVAMRELTPEQRACVTLFYLEGRQVDEIAAILGVPPGTVNSRLHAARRAVREALRDAFRFGRS